MKHLTPEQIAGIYELHQMKMRFKSSQLKDREAFINALKGGNQC